MTYHFDPPPDNKLPPLSLPLETRQTQLNDLAKHEDVQLVVTLTDDKGNDVSLVLVYTGKPSASGLTLDDFGGVYSFVTCKTPAGHTTLDLTVEDAYNVYSIIAKRIEAGADPANPHPVQEHITRSTQLITDNPELKTLIDNLVKDNHGMLLESEDMALPVETVRPIRAPAGSQFGIPTKDACAAPTKSADAPAR